MMNVIDIELPQKDDILPYPGMPLLRRIVKLEQDLKKCREEFNNCSHERAKLRKEVL
jgi:hypothetical protein